MASAGRHIAPHRFADARAGRLSADEQAALERHVQSCPSCAEARDRVEGALDAFSAIRRVESPPLRWDHIGARIYWSTSSERRARTRAASPTRWPALVPALAMLLTSALWLVLVHSRQDSADPPGPQALSPALPDVRPGSQDPGQPGVNIAATALTDTPARPTGQLSGQVTLLAGQVLRDGQPLGFDDIVTSGTELATGADGRVTIQYDQTSGFTLGPRSSVTLARFDRTSVVLAMTGEIVAEVHKLDPTQQFIVRAGGREVRVRGTIFKVVQRDDELAVSCSRGAVVIAGGDSEVDVKAGEIARLVTGQIRRQSLDMAAIASMQHAVPRLPTWPATAIEKLTSTSARLDIATSAKQSAAVEIDGIAIASAPFALRVTPGRHHVKVKGSKGDWIEVAAGGVARPRFRLDALAVARSSTARSHAPDGTARQQSPRQAAIRAIVDRELHIETCTRSLRKQGLAEGGYLVVEIGVGRQGEIRHLRVKEGNLPVSSEQCISEAIDRIAFPSGLNSVVVYRIDL